MANRLWSDRFVDFLLYDVLDATSLCVLPPFAEHSRETFSLWMDACRKVARDDFAPRYRPMDATPPTLEAGQVRVPAVSREAWKALVELGVIASTRPESAGGQHLPLTVSAMATAYLMAGNAAAYGYAGLTTGAAHLIEAFGSDELKRRFMTPMYEGRFGGTMALTEPQAGSSLADVTTKATPQGEHFLIRGAKIFISGGDHDLTDNIVHLVLARIDGSPPGTKGVSLFAVPKRRDDGASNDVAVSGLIHKIGWKGLPSLALSFGEHDDCRGWLVGKPNEGLRCMFQMMNEARLMVGVNGAATASVAFHESLAYALDRKQGRALGVADPKVAPISLFEHPDVRRMLLRQKAIVEGSLALIGWCSKRADLAAHSDHPATRGRSKMLLDLLTPIAKTFPAEYGFASNSLALQIHGGYGYSSEYLPEALLRDQKLNSIHEGTTQIQSLDLVGRKLGSHGGAALSTLREEILATCARADEAGCDPDRTAQLRRSVDEVAALSLTLLGRGSQGDLIGLLGHATDYLELFSILVIAWMWIELAAHAKDDDLGRGLQQAASYWITTELPRIPALAALCDGAERSFVDLRAEWL